MQGQPPIVWDRAEGFQVFDAWGNCWIDWSSGVLVANAGHSRREVMDAIVSQTASGLLHNYCFPSAVRARFVERLASLLPPPLDKEDALELGDPGGRGRRYDLAFTAAPMMAISSGVGITSK